MTLALQEQNYQSLQWHAVCLALIHLQQILVFKPFPIQFALNNLGWFVVALLLTHRMGKAVDFLYGKYDKKWINMLMSGATFGVTGYLLSNQIVSKILIPDASILLKFQGLIPALVAGAVMLLIGKFVKSQRLQELALGIAMVAGMFVGQLIYG